MSPPVLLLSGCGGHPAREVGASPKHLPWMRWGAPRRPVPLGPFSHPAAVGQVFSCLGAGMKGPFPALHPLGLRPLANTGTASAVEGMLSSNLPGGGMRDRVVIVLKGDPGIACRVKISSRWSNGRGGNYCCSAISFRVHSRVVSRWKERRSCAWPFSRRLQEGISTPISPKVRNTPN